MNFISTFDELNKLYEELEAPVVEKEEVTENFDNESGSKAWNNTVIGYYTQAAKDLGLSDFAMKAVNVDGGKQKAVITAKKAGKQISTEADYIETVDIKNVEDAKECLEYYFGDLSESVESVEEPLIEAADEEIEIVEEEPRQLICECDKCGALVIKAEADVVADEESGLVDVEEECQFCEEAKGYKIVGVVAPYEVAEEEPVEDEEPIEEIPAEEEAPVEEVPVEEI